MFEHNNTVHIAVYHKNVAINMIYKYIIKAIWNNKKQQSYQSLLRVLKYTSITA